MFCLFIAYTIHGTLEVMGARKGDTINVSCPGCGMTVGEQIGGKLALGAAGAVFGSHISPAAAVLLTIGGAVAGHYLINRSIRTCHQCGLVFKIADDLLPA